jgi:hypothetical protein
MAVNENTYEELPALGFGDNGICCCEWMWLKRVRDGAEGSRGNISQSEKRPADAGLFFDSDERSRGGIASIIRSLGGDDHVRKVEKLFALFKSLTES